MMLRNVSEGPAQDKAGLLSTKGHSQKQKMYARENAFTKTEHVRERECST
jgi:hypothetical protein